MCLGLYHAIFLRSHWRGGRVVECTGFENRHTLTGIGSSNLPLSAEQREQCEVLGDHATRERGDSKYAFPWTDDGEGAAGALVKNDQSKPGGTGTMVYFDSEDCSELDRVEAAGGKLIMAKVPVEGFGFFGFFADTEGNMVGLFSKK